MRSSVCVAGRCVYVRVCGSGKLVFDAGCLPTGLFCRFGNSTAYMSLFAAQADSSHQVIWVSGCL